MTKHVQKQLTVALPFRATLLSTFFILTTSSSVIAAIDLTADPPAPGFPEVHVTDALAFGNLTHSLVEDRMLRQTFTNPSTFDIGEMILSLDLNGTDGTANEGAGEGGLVINIYEVEDVNGDDWTAAMPGPSPIKTWTIPQTTSIPATSGRLSVSFTGADIFTLPQRESGTEGYGLEIASVDGTTDMGGWLVTPSDDIDRYPNGVFYREDGTISRASRDAGLSIFEVGSPTPVAGDVTGDGMVTLDDFDVISNNLRDVVGARTAGDATGDGVVNFDDFREWKANFVPPVAGAEVPEPGTTALLASLGLFFASRRRRLFENLPQVNFAGASRKLHMLALSILMLAITFVYCSQSFATVTLTADPDYPTGDDLGAFTLDPEMFGPAGRGVAGTRQLRQTFQVDETFNVGGIVLAADFGANTAGLILDFFEVENVNANTWEPLGNSLKTITVPVGTQIPGTTSRLGLELSGFDTFVLPQRNTDTEGYGIQISNGDESTNLGNLIHSNDGTDHYEGGTWYIENGNRQNDARDLGLALMTTTETPPLPGDTEPDGDVDLEDLATIRANFFMEDAGPTDGDFNGDTIVSFEDFQIWKTNRTSGISVVPEPGSLTLVLLGAVGLLHRQKRVRC